MDTPGIILSIAYTVLFYVVLWLSVRYNVHMFQLNGYKGKEHLKWLNKEYLRQRFCLIFFIPALLLGISGIRSESRLPFHIAELVLFVIPFIGFSLLKKANTKKKLVFTKRVKRLIAADLTLNTLLIALPFLIMWSRPDIGACHLFLISPLLIAFQPWILVFSNFLMKPVEKAVNNSFINDAKKRLKSCSGLTVIGVTGSYGKTSLKFYLQTLLSAKYNVLVTPESYNTPMGVVRTIREQLKSTHEIFICEMGARHVGDIKEICDIVHPDHGVITSVGPQHLETFFNIDNVRKTKFELADALPKDGKLFLNADSEEILKDTRTFNKTYYGVDSTLGYHAENVALTPLGTDFTVVSPSGEKETFHTQLIGSINVLNIIGAIAVAHSFGVDFGTLKVAVRRIKPVPHRLELKENGTVTIIDDAFNSNPVGSRAAVETLKMFDGARILITPGMVELGEKEHELHYKFGTYAAACCDYILLVNKYRTGDIKQGALDSGFPAEKLFEFDRFNEAFSHACSLNTEGHKYILLENDLPDNY